MDDEIVVPVDLNGKPIKERYKIKQIGKNKAKKREKDLRTSKTIREKNKVSRSKFILYAILLLILLLIVLHSPLFNISEIVVEGNNHLSNESIIQLSGVNIGENLYKRNKAAIKKALLTNPYVEDVTIAKKMPGSVTLNITERTIDYMLQFSDEYVYLNSQGYILDQTREKANVPIIEGFATSQYDISLGSRIKDEDLAKMNIIIKIYEFARVNELSQYISKVDITDPNNYVLEMESRGKVINLGNCSNYSDINTKMLYLSSILSVTENEREEIFLNVDLNTSKVYSRPISE